MITGFSWSPGRTGIRIPGSPELQLGQIESVLMRAAIVNSDCAPG